MNIKRWVQTHKILSVVIGIGLLIVLVITGEIFTSPRISHFGGGMEMAAPMASSGSRFGFKSWNIRGREGINNSSTPSPQASEIEVKEGRMKIKSQNAEDDFQKVSAEIHNYGGYVERNDKSITNLSITVNTVLRIPPDKFMEVIKKLKQEFDVRSYNIDNYRIPSQREIDELEVINKTLTDYEKIRKEIEAMSTGDKKINLLMNLTNQELALKQKEKNYQRELSSKQKQGDWATINLIIEQKKSAKLWPEDIGNNFKDRLSTAFKHSVAILDDIVGGSIELFFKVIELIIFAIIIIVPAIITWRIVRIIYRRYKR